MKVHQRDNGVCAGCGLDTDETERTYTRLVKMEQGGVRGYQRTSMKLAKRLGIDLDDIERILDGLPYEEAMEAIRKEQARLILKFYRPLSLNERRAAEQGRQHFREWEYRRLPETCPEFAKWHDRIVGKILWETDTTRRVRAIDARMKSLMGARRRTLQAALRLMGFDDIGDRSIGTSLWQADHILPVIEGGGGCGLENLQTLCTPCHKADTRELARRRALRRKGIDPSAPPPPDNQMTFL